ncbi:MAG: aminotransferase class III-fold pyridoxal phosphate-dependent enzyme [Alphaproteobacteria bacterium]|nr:aminotransferase class III-fold pyridoxal phosphate-dependent enzyme [Alphaproteobacteria bacterium]
MPDGALTNSKIVAAYRQHTPSSGVRATEAREIFPSGIVHDSRHLAPYPIYVDHAQGSHKWDIDGNDYVDYFGGHGALILGHNHPTVMEAVHAQLDKGTHFGACHELEVRWGELVKQLVPCAERVRFTSSGTEANLMALRLARAFTGKSKLVRFKGHFHGWQDHVAFGVTNHFDGTATPGIIDGIAENVLLAPPDDIEATRRIFEAHDDIAAVIIEPTGASFGQAPVTREFVAELRKIATEHGVILIFDEVVTGFRVTPGGAQQHYGITPDMCSLAKILSGGLPGGAVTGRADIFELLDFEKAAEKGFEKIGHQGTFNANPMSAAAGIAALELIAKGDICTKASATAANIRTRLNEVFEEEQVPWACYGDHSGFFLFTNPGNDDITPSTFDPYAQSSEILKRASPGDLVTRLRLGIMTNGVDMSAKPGGVVSAVHTENDVDKTAEAVRQTVRMLKAEGEVTG